MFDVGRSRDASVTSNIQHPTSNIQHPRFLLFLLGLLAGLSLLNHLQNGMLPIACILYISRRGAEDAKETTRCPNKSQRSLRLCERLQIFSRSTFPVVAGLALGCLPYCTMVAYETWRGTYGDSWTSWFIGGGGFESIMFNYANPLAILSTLSSLLWWQFPIIFPIGAFLLFFSYFNRKGRKDCAKDAMSVSCANAFAPFANPLRPLRLNSPLIVFCWIVILGNTLFFAGYSTWDQFSFFLVPFVGLSVIASLALIQCPPALCRLVLFLLTISLIITPFIYLSTPRYTKGYETRYHLNAAIKDPIRKDSGTIDHFLRTALAALPPDVVWVDDGSSYFQAKWLQEREGIRPDIRLEHIATPLMQNVGTDGRTLALRKHWRENDTPWFLVADNPATAPLTVTLKPFGWRLSPFTVGEGLSIFVLQRTQEPKEPRTQE